MGEPCQNRGMVQTSPRIRYTGNRQYIYSRQPYSSSSVLRILYCTLRNRPGSIQGLASSDRRKKFMLLVFPGYSMPYRYFALSCKEYPANTGQRRSPLADTFGSNALVFNGLNKDCFIGQKGAGACGTFRLSRFYSKVPVFFAG